MAEDAYNETLDADEQITAEEEIAAYLFDAELDIGEEDCAEAGRQILKMVLKRFRPDFFEG
jgi:hypothetical protein